MIKQYLLRNFIAGKEVETIVDSDSDGEPAIFTKYF